MTRPDDGWLARWSRWWITRPDQHYRGVRCCACHYARQGTGDTFHAEGWHDDHAGSYLCPRCALRYREEAA